MISADCHYGDHFWLGGGVCVRCGKRLRCGCGQFVTEAGIEAHLERCPVTERLMQEDWETAHDTGWAA